MQILSYLNSGAESLTLFCIKKFTFFGYTELPQNLIQKKRTALEANGAKKIEGIDVEAYFLPASTRKTHIVVFAHTSSLWQLHPKNYDHLKKHADVVLWNPSQLTCLHYQQDLHSVINKVRLLHPRKKITIIGRCATVDPTIAVAEKLSDRNINLVLDRGHGDFKKLARSKTWLSLLSIIHHIILKYFDCQGENKIQNIPGKILFTRTQYDQLMKWGKQDLMDNLIKRRGANRNDQILVLPNSDHWTPWNQDTHRKVYEFIGLKNVDVGAFPQKSKPPTFFSRNIIPILTQAWF